MAFFSREPGLFICGSFTINKKDLTGRNQSGQFGFNFNYFKDLCKSSSWPATEPSSTLSPA